MAVDWEKVKSIADLVGVDDSVLYDESPETDDVFGYYLNPDLTEEEIEDALFWAPFMRGVMLVTGAARQGKGLFANMLAWKMRRYYGKTILMDYRPRRLFDEGYPRHHPFNEGILVEQLSRMSEVATGKLQEGIAQSKGGRERSPVLEGLSREWIATKGQVFLKNSVLVLDEFKRYMYKRRPFRPIGLVLSDLFDIWGHLDMLVIGIAIDKRELDRFSCIPKLTTEVRCTWLSPFTRSKYGLAEYSALYKIIPLKYVGVAGEGVLEVASKPIPIIVEGGKPQECLNGKRWVDLYNTKDAKIIQAPKSLMRQ